MNYTAELARVLRSAYINTELACRFVMAEIHAMAGAPVIGHKD